VREAAIKALTYPATAYTEDFVPPGAINWNDADDNNAFHAKPIVMDLDGTISTEVAVLSQGKKEMPSVVKSDPFWLDPKDPHVVAYVQQAVLGPTVPNFWVYNPAYAQVQNEHVWSVGWVDIMKEGMAPQVAAEKAFKRVEEIFAKYPIAQA
jgi:ABC-type glycerol-3-phosphate transport system substrate-binding protein